MSTLPAFITSKEYLALERKPEHKSEYYNGRPTPCPDSADRMIA
jgi:hypothetical protein